MALSHGYVIVGKRAATYLLTTVVKFSEKKQSTEELAIHTLRNTQKLWCVDRRVLPSLTPKCPHGSSIQNNSLAQVLPPISHMVVIILQPNSLVHPTYRVDHRSLTFLECAAFVIFFRLFMPHFEKVTNIL